MVENEKGLSHEFLLEKIGITDKDEQVKVLDFLHTLATIIIKNNKKEDGNEEAESSRILKIGA